MRIVPSVAVASLSATAVWIAAGVGAAAPAAPTASWGVPVTVQCPPLPTPEDPTAVPPHRDPRCGVDQWEVVPGLLVTSNAYDRQSVLQFNSGGWATIYGSRYWQLRDQTGRSVAGTPQQPEHLPFGTEVPPPPPDRNLSDRARTIVDGLSRVSVDLMPGVRYTSDTSDKSALLTTPQGSLVVQAPYDPATGTRQYRPLNNFQALDAQGRYLMGDTLTFAVPEQDWPNAALPCSDLIRQLPGRSHPGQASTAALTPGERAAIDLSHADTADPAAKPPAVGCRPLPGLTPTADQRQEQRSAPPTPAERDQDINNAVNSVATQVGMAISIGGLTGGVVGLGVGCLIGAAVGTGALSGNLPVGLVAGCIPGAGVGAAIGTVIGSAAFGIPVLAVSGAGALTLLHDQGYIARPLRPATISAAAPARHRHPAPAGVKARR